MNLEKITLNQLLNEKYNNESFKTCDEDTHSIVKIIIIATMQEKAYDFFHIMLDESRKQYTCDLFEKIETTPWYDFDMQEKNRYVVVWKLECVGDSEELVEYFTECFNEFTQAYGDIIVEVVSKESPNECTKIYTHDDQIHVIKNKV